MPRVNPRRTLADAPNTVPNPALPMDPHASLHALARKRFARAVLLTTAMIAIYFGFILLVAFNKPLMGSLVTRGLSLGILLGALVIVFSWLLTWSYVRWTNAHYDAQLEALRH